jgi:2-deoxy-D-gluconate 3-dehydrogenase
MGVIDLFRLDGKTALVTGCSRGLGSIMAIGLAEAGADIIGVSSSLTESGSDIEKEIKALGRDFTGYRCDFSNREDLYAFIKRINIEYPVIDILINNAGTTVRKPAIEQTDEDWDRVIEVNLNAQFVLTREVARGMLERKSGKIIFMASATTFRAGVTVPHYAAAKGAVAQLAKALANEWAAKGLNVNAIVPGYFKTAMTEQLRSDPAVYKSILNNIPTARFAEPEDLKGTVVYLSSQASDYVNGSLCVVDGGFLGR